MAVKVQEIGPAVCRVSVPWSGIVTSQKVLPIPPPTGLVVGCAGDADGDIVAVRPTRVQLGQGHARIAGEEAERRVDHLGDLVRTVSAISAGRMPSTVGVNNVAAQQGT